MKDQLIVKRMYYFTNVLVKLCQLQGSDSIAFDDMWWMKQIVIFDMDCRSICVMVTRCSTLTYDYQHTNLCTKIVHDSKF